MSKVFVALAPYVRKLSDEALAEGLPLQRPLFLHYESDPRTYAIQDAYLYGRDLLVAPVHRAAETSWTVYLPAGDQWIHLWSKKTFAGGESVSVPAPIGEPPVFVRKGAKDEALLLGIATA